MNSPPVDDFNSLVRPLSNCVAKKHPRAAAPEKKPRTACQADSGLARTQQLTDDLPKSVAGVVLRKDLSEPQSRSAVLALA